ncbi:MAG: acetylxylan esterase [Planctomycetaceae bacterium]|jgi:dienelactone hydrolase|nr:acetylxylan esterase [Planctomycetaceae bacterium]MDG2390835.1 acetylxylan esterase [Planctomycetaceae bacterium]
MKPIADFTRIFLLSSIIVCSATQVVFAQSAGDKMIADYFKQETAQVSQQTFAEIKTLEDWEAYKPVAREQLFEMLGLSPRPEKTPLQPVITGTIEQEDFVVEKLHFQSRPGLYVTGNLYRPKVVDKKLPAVLYVCGHGRVKKDGISYGNKTHYQHHGAWFARNGYVCLTIDTLQLGEIEGIHHGTYREKMWWWNARGYTSAGVEAWNCIRALDYLESRPEVDAKKMGVTGRSGGGAYSWWVSALDERIKAAVPVAGITNLQNHVVDGCVEGHCDCMFMVNTYRWDYAMVAALVAPRPLLISNTDKDRIFPLDGVVDVYFDVRKIYQLYGEADKLGLQITEGPHQDTQELRIHAFHWMNQYLKGEDPLIETTAVKFFEPEELKVFDELPADQINTKISETFTVKAEPKLPESSAEWSSMKTEWMSQLREKSFRGWPAEKSVTEGLNLKEVFSSEADGMNLSAYDFTAQGAIELRLYLAQPAGVKPEDLELVVLNVLDEQSWASFLSTYRPGFEKQLSTGKIPEGNAADYESQKKMFAKFKWGMAYIAPRGVGLSAWDANEKNQTQIRRRFMLLGQTLDGMQVWDIRRAIHTLRNIDGYQNTPLWLQSERTMAGNTLYASLFEDDITRLDLWQLPASHHDGPVYLNVLRYLDLPQAVVLGAEKSAVRIYEARPDQSPWEYSKTVAERLELGETQLEIRQLPSSTPSE